MTKCASRSEHLRLFLELKLALRSRPVSGLRNKIEVFYMVYDQDDNDIAPVITASLG